MPEEKSIQPIEISIEEIKSKVSIEQLPKFASQLEEIKKSIEDRVNEATSLECTEKNIQQVKDTKKTLNKEKKA